jgi:DNA-binding CsgD family transcriptional regulator
MRTTVEDALIQLHRAVTPDGVWKACVKLMRAALPVYHVLMGLPSLGVQPIFLRTTLAIPNTEHYFARLARLAPLNDLIRGSPGIQISRMSDHFNPEGNPFYEEFMKPEGWAYSVGMFFWTSEGAFLGQLSINRTAEQGDFTNGEMTLLRALRPQVHAAVDRLLALENGAAARRGLEHSLRALPVPMLVVTWDLGVSYLNNAACEAVIAWLHGPKAARAFNPSTELPADLRAACAKLKAAWNRSLQTDDFPDLVRTVVLPNAIVPGFEAAVEIVDPHSGRSLQPSFVIQFFLPAGEDGEVTDALAKLSKLTQAEQAVARLAAAGHGNTEVARELNVSPSTVRTHLRHVFKKLDISSRGKLASLFARAKPLPPSSSA